MKPILLYADDRPGDREVARLLELELTERGLRVTRDLLSPTAAAAVFVAAHPSEKAVAAMEGLLLRRPLPVLCCYHETSEPLPTGVILIERPLELRRICESLLQVALPSEKEPPKNDGLTLHPETHSAFVGAERVSLSRQEFALLQYLSEHRDRPVGREELRAAVWQRDAAAASNIVDVYIRYLRKKLDEPFDTRRIRTVRGRGYQFVD